MKTKYTYVILVLIILVFSMASYAFLNKSNTTQGVLKIEIGESALKELGINDSYTISLATLSIPGIGVFEPTDVEKEDDKVTLIFDYSTYMNQTIQYYSSYNNSIPTVLILLKDYNTYSSYYIIISSYSINLINYIKEKKSISGNDLSKIMQITKKNPLSLLYMSKIKIDKDEIVFLKTFKFAGTSEIPRPGIPLLQEKEIIQVEDPDDISMLVEYPKRGTHIFQYVDSSLYEEYTSNIPTWWRNNYIEANDGDNVSQEYQRFVKDLLACKYYAEKSYYNDLNILIETLSDLVLDGDFYLSNQLVNMVSLDKYIGQDTWMSPATNKVITRDLPIFVFNIENPGDRYDVHDLHLRFVFSYTTFTGSASGLAYSGLPVTTIHSLSTEPKFIFEEFSLGNEDIGSAVLQAGNTLVTYGEDVIMVEWIIDSSSSDKYYVITPVVTILPLLSITYDSQNLQVAYVDWNEAWDHDYMVVNETSIIAQTELNEGPLILWKMNFKVIPEENMSNNLLSIQAPPYKWIREDSGIIGEDPVSEKLWENLMALGGVYYVCKGMLIDAFHARIELIQYDYFRNGESEITITGYGPMYMFLTGNDLPYYNEIVIEVKP